MTDRAAVVVIGAGIVGASVAYHLAARGCTDVVVLEQAEHEVAASSARSLAGVRHQFSEAVNVRLSLYSIPRLAHFAEEIGTDAELRRVGYLFLIDNAQDWQTFQQSAAMQQSLGVPVQVLAPEQAAQMLPLDTDGLLGATFCPIDGYCNARNVGLGYLQAARARGVRLLRTTPATGIRQEGGRVQAVETPHGPIACETVINAAGSWAGQVAALAGLDVPVQPYRRSVFVTQPYSGLPASMPMTIDIGSGFYMRRERERLLLGRSNVHEPAGHNPAIDWGWQAAVLDAGQRRFPALQAVSIDTDRCWAGWYEVTPDDMPILGRHPHLPSYIDASGFSGHGIMHAPATGMLMAEEVLDERAHTIAIDELRIDRFWRADLLAERNIV